MHQPRASVILLSIEPAFQAKQISSSDYNVTGLSITITDPDGTDLNPIEWDESDGARKYSVPVESAGEYSMTVVHSGAKDGETVEAEESSTFEVKAMKITLLTIVPGGIAAVVVEPETVDPVFAAVEEIMQAIMYAGYEVRDDFYHVVVSENEWYFTTYDGSYVIDNTQLNTYDNYSPSSADFSIGGTSWPTSFTQTTTKMIITSECDLTVTGSVVETLTCNLTIDATMGDTGATAATITGTVIADGVAYEAADMDLASYWIASMSILMVVMS